MHKCLNDWKEHVIPQVSGYLRLQTLCGINSSNYDKTDDNYVIIKYENLEPHCLGERHWKAERPW